VEASRFGQAQELSDYWIRVERWNSSGRDWSRQDLEWLGQLKASRNYGSGHWANIRPIDVRGWDCGDRDCAGLLFH